jgi:hypothetical protein
LGFIELQRDHSRHPNTPLVQRHLRSEIAEPEELNKIKKAKYRGKMRSIGNNRIIERRLSTCVIVSFHSDMLAALGGATAQALSTAFRQIKKSQRQVSQSAYFASGYVQGTNYSSRDSSEELEAPSKGQPQQHLKDYFNYKNC